MTITRKLALAAAVLSASVFGQDYKARPGIAPPAEVGALKSAIEGKSIEIVDAAGKVYCELWMRSTPAPAGKSTEENITMPEVIPSTFFGVIQFPAGAADRRGQTIKPGFYTLRYSNFPITGDHQGVAPQRDFFVLSKLADDTDPAAVPKFADLMVMSRKASGGTHPLVISIWKPDTYEAGLAKQGENDWVLQTKVGTMPMAIILIGRAEG
ncbi:MAG TPA: hypothetical protein VGL53_27205 [Bryobacteraceae bacterium]|jgi:hypothetical protein